MINGLITFNALLINAQIIFMKYQSNNSFYLDPVLYFSATLVSSFRGKVEEKRLVFAFARISYIAKWDLNFNNKTLIF